jgi:hypothetical protein
VSVIPVKALTTGVGDKSVSPSAGVTGSEQDDGVYDFIFSSKEVPGAQPHVVLMPRFTS